jgi:hypothetical protein
LRTHIEGNLLSIDVHNFPSERWEMLRQVCSEVGDHGLQRAIGLGEHRTGQEEYDKQPEPVLTAA